MPTAPSCPTTLYHNSSSRSTHETTTRSRPTRGEIYNYVFSLSLSLAINLSLSLSPCDSSTPCSTPIRGIGPSLSFSLSPSLRFSHRTVFSSLPLRLVPEGNKDGSAYVQPATGGGARLPSVGRTNANDSSMQDGVGIHRGGVVPARCFYI